MLRKSFPWQSSQNMGSLSMAREIPESKYKKAIELMRSGVSRTEAALKAGNNYSTLYAYCERHKIPSPISRRVAATKKAASFQDQTIGCVEIGELVDPTSPISHAEYRSKCLHCGRSFILQYQKFVRWRDNDRLDDMKCGRCANKLAIRGKRKNLVQRLSKRKSA